MTSPDILNWGREVLEIEKSSLAKAAEKLDQSFVDAVGLILNCPGRVVTTGLGKSGHIARKISSTLASTGTPALFLHPSEALHGDLGMLSKNDCLLAIAFGGETDEVLEVAKFGRRLDIKIISITGRSDSSLAKLSDVALDGSVKTEACPLNLAPTASSTLALALGDALAVGAMKARGFGETDFANFHPGGRIGRELLLVGDLMRAGEELPKISPNEAFGKILEELTRVNFGIVAVTENAKLIGAVTDGDLRRGLKKLGNKLIDSQAKDLQNSNPKTINVNALATDALKAMEQNKITSLFVLENDSLVGLIRMHDLVEAKII